MSASPKLESTADIAAMLERFFGRAPNLGPYEWDDFECASFADEKLEQWRLRLLRDIGSLAAPTVPGTEALLRGRLDAALTALKAGCDA